MWDWRYAVVVVVVVVIMKVLLVLSIDSFVSSGHDGLSSGGDRAASRIRLPRKCTRCRRGGEKGSVEEQEP